MYNLSEFHSNSTQIWRYKFNMIGCFVFQRGCHCPNQLISNAIYLTRLLRLTNIWCSICPVTRENVHFNVRIVEPRLHLNTISASFYYLKNKCLQIIMTYLCIHPMCFYLAANILTRINLLMGNTASQKLYYGAAFK